MESTRLFDPATYSQAWADARAIDEDAVMTSLNHGSWEVVPLADGRTKVIYRVVSDPGGRIPRGAQALATGTTLPDNILSFEAEAKRRAQAGR